MARKKTYETISLYFAHSSKEDMELFQKIMESVNLSNTKSGIVKQIVYEKFFSEK